MDNMTLVFLGCWTARTIHGFTNDGENNNGYIQGWHHHPKWMVYRVKSHKKNWWSGVSTIFRNSTYNITSSFPRNPNILHIPSIHIPKLKAGAIPSPSLPSFASTLPLVLPVLLPIKILSSFNGASGRSPNDLWMVGKSLVTSWKRWLRNSRNANHVSSNATKIGVANRRN